MFICICNFISVYENVPILLAFVKDNSPGVNLLGVIACHVALSYNCLEGELSLLVNCFYAEFLFLSFPDSPPVSCFFLLKNKIFCLFPRPPPAQETWPPGQRAWSP